MDDLLLNMLSWAREAGAIQLQYFRGQNLGITNKLNDSDIVTNADKASEHLLISRIRERYPDHAILSEESGATEGHSEYLWVIDPLDGTTNFSAGLPIFCVSVGVKRNGRTVAGVVYAPYLNEMFHAEDGSGAFLNGQPIHVSGKTEISKSVISTGFPVDKETNPDNNLDNFSRIFPHVRGIRRLGSAAIDICYCAAGILDGYWEMNLHEWDVCAAELILKEAGGLSSRFREDRNVCLAAGTPDIYRYIMSNLSPVPGK